MVNKQYDMQGSILRNGRKLGYAEEPIVTYYGGDIDGHTLGNIQDVDKNISNINQFINDISELFYECLYDEDELTAVLKELKTAEQALFRASKIL